MIKKLVLVLLISLVISVDELKYNMTTKDSVDLTEGILKSLNITSQHDGLVKCIQSGFDYTNITQHDWRSIIVIGEQDQIVKVNKTVLVQLTNQIFDLSANLVKECGQLSTNIYNFIKNVILSYTDSSAWMKLLRRLSEKSFLIISHLSVGIRFYDEQRFYDAGIEFGQMLKILLIQEQGKSPKYRMLQMRMRQSSEMQRLMQQYMLSRIQLVEVTEDVQEQSAKSVFVDILKGIVQASKGFSFINDGTACFNDGLEAKKYFQSLNNSNASSIEALEQSIRGTQTVIVPIISDCVQTVADSVTQVFRTIQFFKHLTGKAIGQAFYYDLQDIADSVIKAIHFVADKDDVESASETITKLIEKIILDIEDKSKPQPENQLYF